MEYSSTTPIAITVILVLVAALFVWLSLTMGPMSGLFRGLPRVMALVRSTRRRGPRNASQP